MYENMTFEAIMRRCLARVSSSVDKREGSIIYDAIAPAAAELAIMYIELAYLLDRAFPDTATGEDLTKKCRERSIFRLAASFAVREAVLKKSDGTVCNVAMGTRFSGGDLNFKVTGRTDDGNYQVTCETAGEAGNEYAGVLFPIDYLPDLASAELTDILIPGEDEESDDALRERYFESLDSQAFGGNITDYKNKVKQLQGVGAVRITPVWNGGGSVKVEFLDSTGEIPSSELIEQVQTAIDPTQNQGEGLGLAPIGHVVTVAAPATKTIDLFANLLVDIDEEVAKANAEEAARQYLLEVREAWEDEDAVVRYSGMMAALSGADGIIDVGSLLINGGTSNVTCDGVPVEGTFYLVPTAQ